MNKSNKTQFRFINTINHTKCKALINFIKTKFDKNHIHSHTHSHTHLHSHILTHTHTHTHTHTPNLRRLIAGNKQSTHIHSKVTQGYFPNLLLPTPLQANSSFYEEEKKTQTN